MPLSSWVFVTPFQLSLQLEHFLFSTRNLLFHLMIIVSLLVNFFKLIKKLSKILFMLHNNQSDCFSVVLAFNYLKYVHLTSFVSLGTLHAVQRAIISVLYLGFLVCFVMFWFFPPSHSLYLPFPQKNHRHTFV